MEEIWKPVPYQPFDKVYSVSNLGRVKPNKPSRYSKNGAEVLKPLRSPRGYLHVTLYAEGKKRSCFVHRMVAHAFHGDPIPPNVYVCHRDDCPTNNVADNLYWGNELTNWQDRIQNGTDLRGERNGRAKLTEDNVKAIRDLYATGEHSQFALADRFGVDQTVISKVVLRKSWRHLSS